MDLSDYIFMGLFCTLLIGCGLLYLLWLLCELIWRHALRQNATLKKIKECLYRFLLKVPGVTSLIILRKNHKANKKGLKFKIGDKVLVRSRETDYFEGVVEITDYFYATGRPNKCYKGILLLVFRNYQDLSHEQFKSGNILLFGDLATINPYKIDMLKLSSMQLSRYLAGVVQA